MGRRRARAAKLPANGVAEVVLIPRTVGDATVTFRFLPAPAFSSRPELLMSAGKAAQGNEIRIVGVTQRTIEHDGRCAHVIARQLSRQQHMQQDAE